MILSAAIVDGDGTIYVARQYTEMTRSKVEALYIAFARLITKGKQHTIIETSDVRYIYQAINDLYCVLVTDKHSNILEDIKTLRLFVGAINEYGNVGNDIPGSKGLINEDSITKSRFDLLFVFDEIVALGMRQIDNLTHLRSVIEMKSEEEKAFLESLTKKEKEAKAKSKEKAKELDQQRRNEMLHQTDRMAGRTTTSTVSSSSYDASEPIIVEEQKPAKTPRVMSRGRALKLKPKN